MTDRGLCLEEYLELLQEDYSWDSAHLQADNCEIYYCPGDTIHVAVGTDYEVSGINQEGYVVTVWQN